MIKLKSTFLAVALLCIATMVNAYTSQKVGIYGIGESTSCGAVYHYADSPLGSYTGYTTDQVPLKVAASLSASYEVTAENHAMGGTRIEWNLATSTSPGQPAVLAASPARIVLIYTGGNNALWTSTSYAGGYAVPLSTMEGIFEDNLRTIVTNVKRSGKIPVIVAGANWTSQTLNSNWVYAEYSPALTSFLAIQNEVAVDLGAIRDSSTRLCSSYQNNNTSCAGSSDGIHYTSAGYTKISNRIVSAINPTLPAIRNASIVSRWYAMELNTPPSNTWMSYWSGRINSAGIDAAAEECYTTLGVSEQAWIQNVLTNMGLGTDLYATCYAQMNTYTTNKHGKILNWMLDVFLNNTETSGIYYQARCRMQNKTAVAFAWCYVYNHPDDGSAMTSVTYNFSTVATATANF